MPKFGRAQKFTKANIANIPNDKAIVYKIKNSAGKNVYTGIASRGRPQERLLEHKNIAKEKIPGGTSFQIAQVGTKAEAAKLEKQIIKQEQPKYNEQHKG